MQPRRYLMLIWLLDAMSGASAQTTKHAVTFSVNLDYKSRYLFSGLAFSTGSVLQPGVAVSYNGFTINAYANHDAETDEIADGGFFADYYYQYGELVRVYAGMKQFTK